MTLTICTKCQEIFMTVLKLLSGHDFHRKNFKGHNSVINVGGVIDFYLCTLSDNGL